MAYEEKTFEKPLELKGGCPACGNDLRRIFSKKKNKHYWACMGPEEACGRFFQDDPRSKKPILNQVSREPVPDVLCSECNSIMELVSGGKFGNFLGCSSESCKNTIDLVDQNGPPTQDNLAPTCPSGHGHMRRRSGRNGQFWGCRKYPECSQTRQLNDVESGEEE